MQTISATVYGNTPDSVVDDFIGTGAPACTLGSGVAGCGIGRAGAQRTDGKGRCWASARAPAPRSSTPFRA